ASHPLLWMPRPPPAAPLFPYTTLFRSRRRRPHRTGRGGSGGRQNRHPQGRDEGQAEGRKEGRKEDREKKHDENREGRGPQSGCQIGKHTSELQSRENLVCRLLLEKKKH